MAIADSDIIDVTPRRLGPAESLFIPAVFKGLGTTFRHLFQNVGRDGKTRRNIWVLQYPEEERDDRPVEAALDDGRGRELGEQPLRGVAPDGGRERTDEELLIARGLGDREAAAARDVLHQRGVHGLAGREREVARLDDRIQHAQRGDRVTERRAHDLVQVLRERAFGHERADARAIESAGEPVYIRSNSIHGFKDMPVALTPA